MTEDCGLRTGDSMRRPGPPVEAQRPAGRIGAKKSGTPNTGGSESPGAGPGRENGMGGERHGKGRESIQCAEYPADLRAVVTACPCPEIRSYSPHGDGQ